MKFFESKYYVPLQPVESKFSGYNFDYSTEYKEQVIRDMIAIKDKSRVGNKVKKILETFAERIPYHTNHVISTDIIRNTWTLVEDLSCLRRVDDDIGSFDALLESQAEVYYHNEAEVFVIVTGDDSDDVKSTNLYIPHSVNQFNAVCTIKDLGIVRVLEPVVTPKIGMLTTDARGLKIQYVEMDERPIDFDTMYASGFKDVSDVVLGHLQDENRTGLFIFHGDAGTGKTNYIRWLSARSKRKMVFIPPHMVTTLTQPAFLEFLMRNTGLTFVVEDAEASLSPRHGSENSIVSSILNMTDGLLGDVLKCQFVCTFNTKLTNVDSALLRPGRLLVRHEFGKLSVAEANKYFNSIDSDMVASEPMSLAEVINADNLPTTSKEVVRTSFGFNTSDYT